MISYFIPHIAVQIVSHAVSIQPANSNAGEYFKHLKRKLNHMSIRKTKETKDQVIFTTNYKRRTITVVISSGSFEENTFNSEDTLYLNFDRARLNWTYFNATL